MAQTVRLTHKDSGIIKNGYYGFSWTTFFFGPFPALCRGDFLTFIGCFVICALIGAATAGIGSFFAGFAWAFFYNGYYTRRLLERGYQFNDAAKTIAEACRKLKVMLPAQPIPAISC